MRSLGWVETISCSSVEGRVTRTDCQEVKARQTQVKRRGMPFAFARALDTVVSYGLCCWVGQGSNFWIGESKKSRKNASISLFSDTLTRSALWSQSTL